MRKLNYETGLVELTEPMQELLEWLTGGAPAGETLVGFAERMGVSESTVHRWKKDSSFLKMWQERMIATHAHPTTLAAQLEALNAKALTGDVRSIELYWKLVDKMTPAKVEVTGGAGLADMSDEALAAALARAADAALERSAPESPKDEAARVRKDLGLRTA